MIRRIRIRLDYDRRKSPGTLVILCDKRGRLLYEHMKAPPETKRADFDRHDDRDKTNRHDAGGNSDKAL